MKKIIAVVFTVLLIGNIGVFSIKAEGHTHNNGSVIVDFDNEINDEEQLKTLFKNGGNGYLVSDIKLTEILTIAEGITVNLCLSSKVIDLNGFNICNNGKLNIYDCGDKVRYFSDELSAAGRWGSYILSKGSDGCYETYDGNNAKTLNTIKVTGGVITNGYGVRDELLFAHVGGAIYNTGALEINGGTFIGNICTGGTICNTSKATLVINDVKIIGNRADGIGMVGVPGMDDDGVYRYGTAGILNFGNATMNNGEISNNIGNYGTAIYSGGVFTINDGKFIENKAVLDNKKGGEGGAIYCSSVENFTIKKALFYGNSSEKAGGAISARDSILHIERDVVFEKNTCLEGNGGAIFIYSEYFTSTPFETALNSVTMKGNKAACGGAIYATGFVLVKIEGGNYSKNSAEEYSVGKTTAGGEGGAIYIETARVSISDATIENNSAIMGGGLYSLETGKTGDMLLIKDAKFIDNTASYGAGVYAAGKTEINGITVTGNKIETEGVYMSDYVGAGILLAGGPSDCIFSGKCVVNNNFANGIADNAIPPTKGGIIINSTKGLDTSSLISVRYSGGIGNFASALSGDYVDCFASDASYKIEAINQGSYYLYRFVLDSKLTEINGELISDGAEAVYNVHETEDVTARITGISKEMIYKGDFSYVKVYQDLDDDNAFDENEALDLNNYEVKEGSVNVVLKKTYLDTLEVGQYVFNVDVKDTSSKTYTFNIPVMISEFHVHGSGEDVVTFKKFVNDESDLEKLFTVGGYGYLNNDIKLTKQLVVTAKNPVYLCLNDHVLDLNKFNIHNNGTLTIYSCGETKRYFTDEIKGSLNAGTIDETAGKDGCYETYIGNTSTTEGAVEIIGGVITNGYGTKVNNFGMYVGGAIHNSGILTINSGNIVGNLCNGGAIYNELGLIQPDGYSKNYLTINGGYIAYNSGADLGMVEFGSKFYKYGTGGIVNSANFTMNGGEISNNVGNFGGAIYNDGVAKINDGTFRNNRAIGCVESAATTMGGLGGAIYNRSTTVTIEKAIFEANKCTKAGGAICNTEGVVKVNSNVVFKNNEAINGYGGAYSDYNAFGSSLGEFNAVTMTNNKAAYGGSVYSSFGELVINGGLLKNNEAYSYVDSDVAKGGEGGAIYTNVSFLELDDDVKIKNNKACYGGGLYSSSDDGDFFVTIKDATISSNSAKFGAGIYAKDNINLVGGIIRGNTISFDGEYGKDYAGAGVYYESGNTLMVGGDVIVKNNYTNKMKDNLALNSGSTLMLSFTDDFKEGAEIGIRLLSRTGVFMNDLNTDTYKKYFVSDKKYKVTANEASSKYSLSLELDPELTEINGKPVYKGAKGEYVVKRTKNLKAHISGIEKDELKNQDYSSVVVYQDLDSNGKYDVGEELNLSSYEIESGSINVILKKSYLDTLNIGKYVFNVDITDFNDNLYSYQIPVVIYDELPAYAVVNTSTH